MKESEDEAMRVLDVSHPQNECAATERKAGQSCGWFFPSGPIDLDDSAPSRCRRDSEAKINVGDT